MTSETMIAVAFILDRAEHYSPSSGIRCALDELAEAFADGEHLAAEKHGELDDLLASLELRQQKEARK